MSTITFRPESKVVHLVGRELRVVEEDLEELIDGRGSTERAGDGFRAVAVSDANRLVDVHTGEGSVDE